MTTAHRPTFNPARGGTGRAEGDLSKLTQQYSSKDMPSHKVLKYRQSGQGTTDDLRKRDLRRELEDKERTAARERRAEREGKGSSSSSSSKRPRMEEIEASGAIDADEPYEEDNSDADSDSDEDDTAALMEELARIKKERQVDKAKKDAEEEKEHERVRKDQIMHGNPLLNLTPSSGEEGFKVKRRWDDDVVFKNCAKGLEDKKNEPTFINDAIRSEFHRKFMDKYVK